TAARGEGNGELVNIRYVAHLGDIVQRGEVIEEWDRAKAAMDLLLRAGVAHGTVMGNHDDIPPNDLQHDQTYQTNYLDYFGPQVFDGCPWYVGSSATGAANYQMLVHQGVKILFLNFSIDHPQDEIDWAHQVVADNPDALVIVGTHRYLYDFKLFAGRYGETVSTPFGDLVFEDNPVPDAVDPNNGQALFQQFVTAHPNILMIHSGHFHAEWLRMDALNGGGNPVIQILTDYQSTRNGGDGWLRVYTLDLENDKFLFDSYSPTLDRKRSTLDHFIETIYLSWDQRSDLMEFIGIDPENPLADTLYLLFIERELKEIDGAPDFLASHPDYDEPEERAYYEQYYADLFMGNFPPGYEDFTAFQKFWVEAFAANPDDLFDFSNGPRSPSGSLNVDYSAYTTP
ncbi:MAG: metallophosphoesterase, partial [Pseudomonadota bacterium]